MVKLKLAAYSDI